MPDNFYKTQRWKKLRKQALRRDAFQCIECRKYFRSRTATVVHHVKPRELYPELQWRLDTLESLCEACHNRKHPEKGRARAAGRGYPPTLGP